MDIHEHLQSERDKEFLRFSTAGSVDDGKSTLIGRLLHDSKNVYEDHINSVRKATQGQEIDWALLTDGLKAEREQGITIDVAYRYFATAKRKYIIADTPGHEQYTRNMATGASTADLTIILIDARKGVLPQSKRHAFIASLLQIPHMVVAVNKMDLVDYSEAVFNQIRNDFTDFAAKFRVTDIRFIPISALVGDNVVERGENMPWYHGESLLEILDGIYIGSDRNLVDLRFPVQYVSRPNQDFRGYCGQVASGILRKGDEVMVLPSLKTSRVSSIVTYDGELQEAFPPLSVCVTLEDELDISRGDMLVHLHNRPRISRQFEAMIVWMDEQPLDLNTQYFLKQTTQTTKVAISELRYGIDIQTLSRNQFERLHVNEIGRIAFMSHQPLKYDPYEKNRQTGSFILIDPTTNRTAAAGMIIDREPVEDLPPRIETQHADPLSPRRYERKVTLKQRVERLAQEPLVIWLTGLVSAGKSEVAYALEQRLFEEGKLPTVLRGGDFRRGLSSHLDFNTEDIAEHLRRVAETCRLFNEAGLIVICSFVSPLASLREQIKEIIGVDQFVEVHVDTSLERCRQRDETGLYQRADRGEIARLPGINAPYEAPTRPAVHLPMDDIDVDQAVERLMAHLAKR
jgi:bifunctional enzyme CysN/CysC